jgi:Fe-S protein assembly chaperone HscA
MGIEVGFGRSQRPTERPKVVGIDLGTTNSLAASVNEEGVPVILRGADGTRIVPSILSFRDGEVDAVGETARRRLQEDPTNAVYSVKRLMGRALEDMESERRHFPFALEGEGTSVIRVRMGDRTHTPTELSAHVLRELRSRAEAELDGAVHKAVITVPAHFDDAQRQATRDAGKLAGLEVLRIINEPTAAALAYGLGDLDRGVVAVYDFGGGTFDVSILRIRGGIFEVLATAGDTYLGGDDIDHRLMDDIRSALAADRGMNVEGDADAHAVIREAVTEAKITLSNAEEARISVQLEGMKTAWTTTLSRSDFEARIGDLIERTLAPCRQAMADAELAPADIDEVILVGGSTRIPLVRRSVEALFGRPPHSEIDPDEVVALGAAVQADVLVGGRRDLLLLDVTPLSLGIETMGGVLSKLIHRNSTIPASATEEFTTSVDGQTGVDIHVLQGEREFVADSRSLARFTIPIESMPAGIPRVAVRFMIDANGILNVSAVDVRGGGERSIDVKPTYGLTDDEVEVMLLDALNNAEEDMERRLRVEAVQEAEGVLEAVEKGLASPAGDALASEERALIDASVIDAKAAMDSGEKASIVRARVDAVNDAAKRLAHLVMDAALGKLSTDEITPSDLSGS